MWMYQQLCFVSIQQVETIDIKFLYVNTHICSQCIELLGANCFTQEQYAKILGLLKDMLELCFSRASERQAKRQDEDYDEQVEEELEGEVSLYNSSTLEQ